MKHIFGYADTLLISVVTHTIIFIIVVTNQCGSILAEITCEEKTVMTIGFGGSTVIVSLMLYLLLKPKNNIKHDM